MRGFAAVVFAAMVAAAMLVAPGTARAADIDLSTWTCQQFASANKDDIGVILAWLDGYYKDEDDPPVIDTTKFVDNAKKLGEYCAAHPDIGLITATDKLFQKE
jgi:acid stress chaperone HdeB